MLVRAHLVFTVCSRHKLPEYFLILILLVISIPTTQVVIPDTEAAINAYCDFHVAGGFRQGALLLLLPDESVNSCNLS